MSLSKQDYPRPLFPLSGIAAAFQEIFDDTCELVVDIYRYTFEVENVDDGNEACVARGAFGTVACQLRSRCASMIVDLKELKGKENSDKQAFASSELMLLCGAGALSMLEPTGMSSTLALCGLNMTGRAFQAFVVGYGLCWMGGAMLFYHHHQPHSVELASKVRCVMALLLSGTMHILIGCGGSLPHAFAEHFANSELMLYYAKDLMVNPLMLANIGFVGGTRVREITDAMILSSLQTGLLAVASMPAMAHVAFPCCATSVWLVYRLKVRMYKLGRRAQEVGIQNPDRVRFACDGLMWGSVWTPITGALVCNDIISAASALHIVSFFDIVTNYGVVYMTQKSGEALEAATKYLNPLGPIAHDEPQSEPDPESDA